MYTGYLARVSRGDALTHSEFKTFLALESLLGEKQGRRFALPSADAVADYANVSRRTVFYHVRRGRLLKQADGSFLKSDVDAWIQKHGSKKTKDDREELEREIAAASLRYRVAKAEEAEMRAATLRGDLIPKKLVEEEFTNRAYELRHRLSLLYREVSHDIAVLTGAAVSQVEGILKTATDRWLVDYSRSINLNVEVKKK
jgi:hypothetical protein